MASRTMLIVTADDFGLHGDVNAAVEQAHCDGILNAASLMVSAPAAADAVHLVAGSVVASRVGDLAPEPDHHALRLVDDDLLIWVGPPVQAGHLVAERVLTDLVAAHRHEVDVGAVVPAVGGVLGRVE